MLWTRYWHAVGARQRKTWEDSSVSWTSALALSSVPQNIWTMFVLWLKCAKQCESVAAAAAAAAQLGGFGTTAAPGLCKVLDRHLWRTFQGVTANKKIAAADVQGRGRSTYSVHPGTFFSGAHGFFFSFCAHSRVVLCRLCRLDAFFLCVFCRTEAHLCLFAALHLC